MIVRPGRRTATLLGALALLLGACSGSATPAPTSAPPSAAASPSSVAAASPSGATERGSERGYGRHRLPDQRAGPDGRL